MLDETPSGWQLFDFGEVAKIEWGDTSVTKKSYTEEGFTAYSAAGPDGFLPYFDFDCDAVVVSAIGANSGRVFWASGKWTAIKNTMVVLPLEGVLDIRFLYYKAQQQDFWHISGGAQPFIGLKNARKQNVLLPPLPEQERIAEILSSVDDSIRATEAVIAQAERVKRGLMENLLTGGLGSEAIARGEVPDGWDARPIAEWKIDLVDGDRGKEYPKSNDFLDEGYCLFLNAKNVTKSGWQFDERKFISEERHNKLRKGTLERGDIVITTRGTIGNIAHYDDRAAYPVCRINSGMAIFRNHDPKVLTRFLKVQLEAVPIQQQIEKMTYGSAQPALTIKTLKSLNLPVPDAAEQQRIINALETADASLESSRAYLAQLQTVKRGLMDDLLTGRVRTV